MHKNIYKCPYEGMCSLKKHCTVLTTLNELKEPMSIWVLCPEVKKETGGKEKERLVKVSEQNKAA